MANNPPRFFFAKKKEHTNIRALDFMDICINIYFSFYPSPSLFFPSSKMLAKHQLPAEKSARESPRSTVALERGKVICIIHQSKKKKII